VDAALARGHVVSVFSRGRTETTVPTGVEVLHGDRDGDLSALAARSWDAVIDVAAYRPGWVRSLGETLAGRVGHYTFISSVDVYDTTVRRGEPIDEGGTLKMYDGDDDPYSPGGPGEHYGALKVLCEREAEAQFPGRTLVLRPCYIVGPGDRVGALAYWSLRARHGGRVLAAGDPSTPVHVVDVRDLAAWTILMAERTVAGPFNVVGPAEPLTWGALLRDLGDASPIPIEPTWVSLSWLAERGVTDSFSALRFWADGVTSGGRRLLNDRARACGLSLRPLEATVSDTLDWYGAQPIEHRADFLLGVAGRQTLDESMALERKLLDDVLR
jgi:2'-hydroxyisoflavone reductase